MADSEAQEAGPAPGPAGIDEPVQLVETEAKLHASRRVFADLGRLEEVAGWRLIGRHDVSLRDTYWDTADRRLARAGCTLRVREMDGAEQAELTLKGPVPVPGRPGGAAAGAAPATATPHRAAAIEAPADGAAPGGAAPAGAVWSRSELTVATRAGSGPTDWARLPAARPLLRALERLGVGAGEGLSPTVVLLNPRRESVLEANGTQAVVSLDEVAVEGAPYRRRYVEIELKRGQPEAMAALVRVLVERYNLRPSRRAKVQAARDWLDRRAASPASPASPASSG